MPDRLRIPPWVSALFGLGILGLGVWWAGPRAVATALAGQDPLPVLLATAAIASGTWLAAWNVFRLTDLSNIMPFGTFLRVYWRAWAVGLSVPGQVGDLVSTLWQLRGRIDMEFVAGRMLVDKAVTLACMLLLMSWVPAVTDLLPFPLFLLPPLAAVVLLVVGILVTGWLVSSGAKRWPSHGLVRRLRPVAAAFAAPWSALALNAAVSLAKIGLTGGAYWLLLAAADNERSFLTVLAISQTAGLIAYLPISFNGIGTVELSAVQLFGLVGYAAPHVLSAYVVLRLCALATAWVPASLLALQDEPGPIQGGKDAP